MEFCEELKYYREKANMTQARLGKILGVPTTKIEEYEKGIESPNVDMLQKISKYLHVNPNTLLGTSVETRDERFERFSRNLCHSFMKQDLSPEVRDDLFISVLYSYMDGIRNNTNKDIPRELKDEMMKMITFSYFDGMPEEKLTKVRNYIKTRGKKK